MTTSISMNIFPLYTPPLVTFKRLRDAGFGAVDFNYCDYVNDPDLRGEKFAAYVNQLKSAGEKTDIQFYQAHAPCITYWQKPEERARLWAMTDHCLETTASLGVQWLVFHPLTNTDSLPGCDAPTVLETNHRFVLDLLSRCRGSTGIAIENCGGGDERRFADTAEDLVTLTDAVNDTRCGVCWDTGHGHLSKADQESSLAMLGHRLKCLHVQENDGVADMHLLPYAVQNGIDWSAIARGLAAADYQGTFSFEAHYAFKGIPEYIFETILHHASTLAEKIDEMTNIISD